MWFESFHCSRPAIHDPIQFRLVRGQKLAEEISSECAARPVDPYTLLTECSRGLFYDYPVGTRFLLKAKLTDNRGSKPFFYTNFNWPPLEIVQKGKPDK